MYQFSSNTTSTAVPRHPRSVSIRYFTLPLNLFQVILLAPKLNKIILALSTNEEEIEKLDKRLINE